MAISFTNYPLVEMRTNQVRELLLEIINKHNSEVELAIIDMLQAGGKMLRPAIFFLFTEFGDHPENEQKLIKIAASLEILHMATLIHDDIIDDSPLRRGVISVQAKFGKDIAVYAGDLLFTKFFQLINETMNGTKLLKINADTMENILNGELSQKANRFNPHNSVDHYIETVTGKTAELFKLACLEGAYFSGCDQTMIDIAGAIGESIGIAYQINDDILDYTADQTTLKKPILEDLSEGIYTLPLLLAVQKNPTFFEPLLNAEHLITKDEAMIIAFHVKQSNGIDMAIKMAQEYTDRAHQLISDLPTKKAKAVLTKVVNKMLTRKF